MLKHRGSIVALSIYLLLYQSRAEILYSSTASCENDIYDPVSRSKSFSFCYFILALSECNFSQKVADFAYFPYYNCSGSKCENSFSLEDSLCFIQKAGSDWNDPMETLVDMCIHPMYGERVEVSESRDHLCYWPLPLNSSYTITSTCEHNVSTLNFIVDLGFTLSEDPFSCIIAGKCKDITQPVSIVCSDNIKNEQGLNELLELARTLSKEFTNRNSIENFATTNFSNLSKFNLILTIILISLFYLIFN